MLLCVRNRSSHMKDFSLLLNGENNPKFLVPNVEMWFVKDKECDTDPYCRRSTIHFSSEISSKLNRVMCSSLRQPEAMLLRGQECKALETLHQRSSGRWCGCRQPPCENSRSHCELLDFFLIQSCYLEKAVHAGLCQAYTNHKYKNVFLRELFSFYCGQCTNTEISSIEKWLKLSLAAVWCVRFLYPHFSRFLSL